LAESSLQARRGLCSLIINHWRKTQQVIREVEIMSAERNPELRIRYRNKNTDVDIAAKGSQPVKFLTLLAALVLFLIWNSWRAL
jgi:hypothetical protein